MSEQKAMIVSVGGSPQPVIYSLSSVKPRFVCYFCSEGSRQNAQEIQDKLPWSPQARFIEVCRFEELGPCYRELRGKLPAILREWGIQPSQVTVDYTGGTKTMSAALVMAGLDLFGSFSYVGGDQREKGGLGVTIDGREKTFYQSNPWDELAVRQMDQVKIAWDSLAFDEAARIFTQAAAKVIHGKPLFETFALLAEGLSARHSLDWKTAKRNLGQAKQRFPLLYARHPDHGIVQKVDQWLHICTSCGDKDGGVLLRELLDNALRTASQKRFEDAAARLYRAMELQGQIWLQERTDNVFENGKADVSAIPESLLCVLKSLPFDPIKDDSCQLSMNNIFTFLDALQHPGAHRVAEEMRQRNGGKWNSATQMRNNSILAHGLMSISEEGFAQMKQVAQDLLGFDLSKEFSPIGEFNPLWVQMD